MERSEDGESGRRRTGDDRQAMVDIELTEAEARLCDAKARSQDAAARCRHAEADRAEAERELIKAEIEAANLAIFLSAVFSVFAAVRAGL